MKNNLNKPISLLDIVICLVIIVIILLTVLPSLLRSRRSVNEAMTVAILKEYSAAQIIFRTAGYIRIDISSENTNMKINSFANDYSNLYYGTDDTGVLNLVPQSFADARSFQTQFPYYGYCFQEDGNLKTEDWVGHFALIAAPSAYNETGVLDFWIDENGIVLDSGYIRKNGAKRTDVFDTPLHSHGTGYWSPSQQ